MFACPPGYDEGYREQEGSAGGKVCAPVDSRRMQPAMPPPAIARFQTVTTIDYATSPASPAVFAEAV